MTANSPSKIIAVIGPTASGKSELAVQLAKKFNGEIISCDSRQIYRGMNIGTGKVTGKWLVCNVSGRLKSEHKNTRRAASADQGNALGHAHRVFLYKGVNHYCIDYVSPTRRYSAALFQRDASKTIADIVGRGKLPIICGGTGHWLDAVINHQKIPAVPPNPTLRKKLEKLPLEELYQKLKLLDPDRAAVIDWHNPRRLIRALEIVITTGKPVPAVSSQLSAVSNQTLWVGLYPGQDGLYKKIDARLAERLKQGMIKEVRKLHGQGLSWKKLESFGLEYKYIALYLRKKLNLDDMTTQLSFAIKHYAKRQMTWFRKNEQIRWTTVPSQTVKLVADFLK